MKKLFAVALAAVVALSCIPASSAASDQETVEAVVRTLGIMNGDQNGNLQLERSVTRAEFVRMMVAASAYEDSVGGGGKTSPFTDVKASHWAVEYIKVAVDAGWVAGYTDGTFRPNETVTLDMAAAALTSFLGYGREDISGAYPAAHIAKFRSLGLDEDLTLAQGQALSRRDCMYIFYNLMGASNKSGTAHGVTLGYALGSDGRIDYQKLVEDETKGPFVAQGVPNLAFEPGAVYRDGQLCALSDVQKYDVYYTNEKSGTVWVYSDKAVGMYTDAQPGPDEPESVTVGGNTYALSEKTAEAKMSRRGGFVYGDTVVLLLDKNGGVVDAISPDKSPLVFYGVVTGIENRSYDAGNGEKEYGCFTTVRCTDGVEREFFTESKKVNVGRLAMAGYQDGGVVLKSLSEKRLSGRVDADAAALGKYPLAADVEIMDYAESGRYAVIYPSRLAGATLNEKDVRFYALNAKGEISRLILDNATGDLDDYALVTSVSEEEAERGFNGVYQYLLNGQSGQYTSTTVLFGIGTGPAALIYGSERISRIKPLAEVEIDLLYETHAVSDGKEYALLDDVQVYIERGDSYELADVAAIADSGRYRVTGWRDDSGYAAGGRIRILTARLRPQA